MVALFVPVPVSIGESGFEDSLDDTHPHVADASRPRSIAFHAQIDSEVASSGLSTPNDNRGLASGMGLHLSTSIIYATVYGA